MFVLEVYIWGLNYLLKITRKAVEGLQDEEVQD